MANDITLFDNPAFTPWPILGQCLHAGWGKIDSYTLPTGADGFTVRAWIKTPTNTEKRAQVVARFGGLLYLSINPDDFAELIFGSETLTAAIQSTASTNRGVHLEAAFSETAGAYFFVNGHLVASRNAGYFPTPPAVGAYTGPAYFKCYSDGEYLVNGSLGEVSVYSGILHTADFARPAGPTPANAPGLVNVWRFNGNGLTNTAVDTTAPALTFFPASNPNIYHSPYNTMLIGGMSKGINPGAYRKTIFEGGLARLHYDTSNGSKPSFVSVEIDKQGPVRYPLADIIDIETNTGIAGTAKYHTIEIGFDCNKGSGADKWNTQETAHQFLGISTTGTALRATVQRALKGFGIGTSISEAAGNLRAQGDTPFQSSSRRGFMYQLRDELGVELGIIGFGSSAITHPGNGNVPAAPDSWKYMWQGQLRSFADQPDFVFIEHPTNDGPDVRVPMTAMVNDMLTTLTKAKIYLLQPLLVNHEDDLKAVQAGCSDPTRVFYISAAGVMQNVNTDTIDLLHPYAFANTALIAPAFANLIRPTLFGGATTAPTIPTGSIPATGLTPFKFVGANPIPLTDYPGLTLVRELVAGSDWASGKPTGANTQAVNQYTPGRHYVVKNATNAAISMLGAQL